MNVKLEVGPTRAASNVPPVAGNELIAVSRAVTFEEMEAISALTWATVRFTGVASPTAAIETKNTRVDFRWTMAMSSREMLSSFASRIVVFYTYLW